MTKIVQIREALKQHFDSSVDLEELCQDVELDIRKMRRGVIAEFILDIVNEARRQRKLDAVLNWMESHNVQLLPSGETEVITEKSEILQSSTDNKWMRGSRFQTVETRVSRTSESDLYSVELNLPNFFDFPSRKMILDSEDLLIHNTNARDYGLLLGQALFADTALGDYFRESLAVLQREGKGLRVRLRLGDSDLHDIRWERLHYPLGDEWHPLAITANTPFSRYILAEDWGQPQPVSQRPLRILVIIATPEDLKQYGLSTISQAERQAVHAIFDGLPDIVPTYLETDTTTPPTLEYIRRELASGYHIVHFVCHGTVNSRGTVLYLEHERGGVELVSSGKLIGSFRAAGTPPHFCFLAACESAANSYFDAFMPLGPRLVAAGGFTAVVAMSDKVSLTTASKFTEQFYARLLSHGFVDLAVNEARALVRDNWDWSVPVLFSRLPDNRLLAVPESFHLEDRLSVKLHTTLHHLIRECVIDI